jgi:hypothetical protein
LPDKEQSQNGQEVRNSVGDLDVRQHVHAIVPDEAVYL